MPDYEASAADSLDAAIVVLDEVTRYCHRLKTPDRLIPAITRGRAGGFQSPDALVLVRNRSRRR